MAMEAIVFRTARYSNERLSPVSPLRLQSTSQPNTNTLKVRAPGAGHARVTVNAAVRYQKHLGFGGSFTESAATVLHKLAPALQQEVVDAYFSIERGGLGYNMGRLHMNSCDFSHGNWSCCETPGDMHLTSFSIARYREAIIPMIRRAETAAGRRLKLLFSPWSPPAWMKDTGKMCKGGKLRPDCRNAWARHYALFAKALEAEGLPPWGLTVQNEPEAVTPWENCIYTAEEERDFVRDFLGPTLEAEGLSNLNLIVWDHNRDQMFTRACTIYSDPSAARYIWGLGFHWYGDLRYEDWATFAGAGGMACFDNVQRVHELRPDKHLIFTEGCQERGPHIGDWKLGERYAESIIRDLNNWTEAWIDWNLVLDENGGPNHVGNFCSAPIIADTMKQRLIYQSSYYYIGHFSRFVRPGALRVACASSRVGLESTAFVNPDGSIVAVVLNQGDKEVKFWLECGIMAERTIAPAHSITTFILPAAAAQHAANRPKAPLRSQL